MELVKEGNAELKIEKVKIASKQMDVFYNPVMADNRTISILLLNSIARKEMQIALPLAGSGVRGIRFLKELEKGKIKNISFNDLDREAISSIEKNLKLNNIKISQKIVLSNQEANLFLLNSLGFDYIDIDPFGTPNPFLDSSIRRISREGILGVTATDTSALCGTYTKACQRKYWARPLRTSIMHEIGLRILIRKVQLIGAQYDKALVPVYSYSKDHYMRVFLLCEKGKSKVDSLLKDHGEFGGGGPMFLGKLWDAKLAARISKSYKGEDKQLNVFLLKIAAEAKISTIGFYDLPAFVKEHKLSNVPKQEKVIDEIKKLKHKVCESHFARNSLRSDVSEKELIKIIKKLNKK